MPSPHDKIIATAAKTMLQPLGLRRKGRSRLWIGDHGWWLAIVEFQPSGFQKGGYLNVAAHWLWTDQDFISFDLGNRAAGFEAYETDEQFERAAVGLATIAAQQVRSLVARLPSIREAADILRIEEAKSPMRGGSWPTYHAGVAAGLAGRGDEAKSLLASVTDLRVKKAAERYASLTSDPAALRALALSIIAKRREALGLPAGVSLE